MVRLRNDTDTVIIFESFPKIQTQNKDNTTVTTNDNTKRGRSKCPQTVYCQDAVAVYI